MKRLIFGQFILGAFILAGQVAQAADTTALADWCVNLNADINTACNGGTGGTGGLGLGGVSTNADGGTINLVSFDSTLEPDLNGLGSVTVSLGTGDDQSVLFYADYDLDYATYGSFDDSGITVGALPSGVTYELDDPNVSNIFSDFAGDALANTNNVGTPSAPPNQCCDVAFALGLGGLDVPSGGSGTVTFTIGTVAPASGFYIQQTNATVGDSIYLSAVANIQGSTGPPPSTPEPSTFVLAIGSLGLALFVARRRRVAE